jgi:twitching motility protein PilT
MITLHQLLKATILKGASDLHITAGNPPSLRVDGLMVRVKSPAMTPEETRNICYSFLTDSQKSEFEEKKELDFSFEVKKLARFRGNLLYQKGAVAGVFRRIPIDIPHFSQLGLPKSVVDLTQLPNGLVLVCGPTGSGKSTTIASLLDKINEEIAGHIITLEDPIEFTHSHKACVVNQREIGSDSLTFGEALRHVLRQDPDVVMLGELRDLTTVEAALTIAETGHLVFATLHTNSAVQTVSRIVNVFPGDQQDRVRVLLSSVLRGVVCQQLIAARQGGRVMALEAMLVTSSIRNLIRENKLHQLYGQMQVGQDQSGMMTMNQSLIYLLTRRKITHKEAFAASSDVEELNSLIEKTGV